KEFGGVFVSHDAGQSWKQLSEGLDGRDVFLLRQANDNSIVAGTDHGIFQLKRGASAWIARTPVTSATDQPTSAKKPLHLNPAAELNTRITALDVTDKRWFAATATGLFVSLDQGETWAKEELRGVPGPTSISVSGKMVAIANRNAIAVSVSGGESWLPATKP